MTMRTGVHADVGSGKDREYMGFVDCISRTVRQAGVISLYQGFGVSVQARIKLSSSLLLLLAAPCVLDHLEHYETR